MSAARVLTFPRPVVRGAQEREFLPAALEIIDTPASPAGRAIAVVIVAAAVLAIVWASIGHVDVIASASGRIVPIGRSKIVQPLEAGVVRAIRVADGDHVQEGQSLIELDATQAEADSARLAHDLMQARLDHSRLEGLRRAWQTGSPPMLSDPPSAATKVEIEAATAAMRAQAAEQAAKLAALDQQIAEKQAEGEEATASLEKLQASLPLVSQEEQLRRTIMQMQFGNKVAWLEAEERLVEQQHELVIVAHKRDEADAARVAFERQREEVWAEYEKTVLTDLTKAEQQTSQSAEELVKAQAHALLDTLRAPIDGTVQQLAVHTVGGVVTPAQAVLVVVPDNPGLVVEAQVQNKDIGFVHPDQEAEIKVEAFNFTRYGLIHGKVLDISRDAVRDDRAEASPATVKKENSGDEIARQGSDTPGYMARIALDQTEITTENGPVALGPGMAATAEIKTGRRRVISYLLSPLMRYRQEGLTER